MLPSLSWRVRVYLFESCVFNFLFARAPLTFANIWKCFWRTSLKAWFDRPVQPTVFKCKRNANTSAFDRWRYRAIPSFVLSLWFHLSILFDATKFFRRANSANISKTGERKKGNRIYKIKTIRYLITSKWHVYYV